MAEDYIDIVEDFSYDSCCEDYNRRSKAWRVSSKTPYAYRYSDNPKERSFVSGKAVTKPSAASVERETLTRVCEAIGAALLIYLVSEAAGSTLLIRVFQFLNMDVHLDFLSFRMSGSQLAVAGVRILTLLLKYGIPICVLIGCFRLPVRVMMPRHFRAIPETELAIGCGMLCSALCMLCSTQQSIEDAQRIFDYKDGTFILGYGIISALLTALLAELFLHGLMLPVLRQFGDTFAVCLIAAFAFLFPNTLPARIGELAATLCTGYILLRGGSFWNCVLMRALYILLNYACLVLVYANHSMPLWQFIMLTLVSGLALLLLYSRLRRSRLLLSNRQTQLTVSQKLAAACQTVTLLPWIGFSLLLMLVQIFF